MAEAHIFFQSGEIELEGLIYNSADKAAVVVTHPHPLYGGDMQNNVVDSILQAYRREGYSTLRFNFRGVGQSGGRYGDGIGERQDVVAAVSYLHNLGKSPLDLVGYSFGAWVNALALKDLNSVGRMIMVSPPVNFMDFSFLEYTDKIKLMVAGSEDDIAPPEMIKKMISRWNPEAALRIIQEADHFYWGKTGELEKIIRSFLQSVFQPPNPVLGNE
jgi:alpha/beta superfamily hydrolase